MSVIKYLTFDIETIPYRGKLSDAQEEEILKKSKTALKNQEPTAEELASVRGMVMATSPFLGEIICIGLHGVDMTNKEESISLIGEEKEILEKFWNIISGFKGTFISFNGLEFDAPFIIKRSLFHKVLPTNNNFLDLTRFSGFPHFDVRAVINDFDKYATGNLDMLTQFCGVETPKGGDIKAENVAKAFNDGRIKEIAEYCLKDVIATYQLYLLIKDYTFKPTR